MGLLSGREDRIAGFGHKAETAAEAFGRRERGAVAATCETRTKWRSSEDATAAAAAAAAAAAVERRRRCESVIDEDPSPVASPISPPC